MRVKYERVVLLLTLAGSALSVACGDDPKPAGSGTGGGGGAAVAGTGGKSVAGMGGTTAAGSGMGGASAGSGGSGGAPVPRECKPLEPGATGDHGLVSIYETTEPPGFHGPIGVDGDKLYFVGGSKTLAYPLAGGDVAEIGSQVEDNQLVHDGKLFWIANEGVSPIGTLHSAPLTDLTQATQLAEEVPVSQHFVADENGLFIASRDAGGIFTVPLAGGVPTLVVPEADAKTLIVYDGYLYWFDYRSNMLERVATAGGVREPLVAPTAGGIGGPLAATAMGVFWGDDKNDTVEKLVPGMPAAQVLWNPPNPFSPVENVAVSGDDLYFNVGFNCGEVFHVKTDGTGAERVTQGMDGSEWLFLGPTHVLVLTQRGGLYRMDR